MEYGYIRLMIVGKLAYGYSWGINIHQIWINIFKSYRIKYNHLIKIKEEKGLKINKKVRNYEWYYEWLYYVILNDI